MIGMEKTLPMSSTGRVTTPAFTMSEETESLFEMLVEFNGLADRLFEKANKLGFPSTGKCADGDGEKELCDTTKAMNDIIGRLIMTSVHEQLSVVQDVPKI